MTYVTQQLYDNFLPSEKFKEIHDIVMSEKFPWFWTPVLGGDNPYYQMCLAIYSYSRPLHEAYDNMMPIICDKRLKVAAPCRVKANLNTRTTEHVSHGFHVDVPFECTTAIFYVNSNNGYTEFEDGTKVNAVANRLVTFPSTLRHSGVTTTDTNRKVVINFNYFESEHGYEYTD